MYALHRHLVFLLVALAGVLVSTSAWAWIETTVKSDVVTVELGRDGAATVTHELMLKVRGGPLKTLSLDGIDADAVVQADATVTRARGNRTAQHIPLNLDVREDGSLQIEIDHKKGLRRGVYLFRFSYQTDLSRAERLRRRGQLSELSWVGPRLPNGVSSAKVLFRIPRADTAPHLPSTDASTEDLGLAEEFDGIFLSQLRREASTDVLEVVRPHVAKGEPVVWRVLIDSRALDGYSPEAPAAAPVDLEHPEELGLGTNPRTLVLGGILLAIALVYAVLCLLKAHWVARACERRGAVPRALVPLPTSLRSTLAGFTLAGAVAVGWLTSWPTVAAALLVVSMVLASHIAPRARSRVRGPGQWLPLTDDEAFKQRPAGPPLPGRILDAGSPIGFVLFALLLVAVLVVGAWRFQLSPYQGLLVFLASAALLPLFCTGRAGELPPDPVLAPRRLLAWLSKRLSKSDELKVVPLARIPEGAKEADELRLKVVPRRRMEGLTAIEVGVEFHHGNGGALGLPYVIVRALDGSAAYQALPRSVTWTRGRQADERVAIIRPKLPTRALSLKLVRRLVQLLTAPQQKPSRRSRGSRLTSSLGKGAATLKLDKGMHPPPAQAM